MEKQAIGRKKQPENKLNGIGLITDVGNSDYEYCGKIYLII